MKCNQVKDLIIEYIDHELSQKLNQEVTGHLNSCPSCKEMEQSLRQAIIEPFRQVKSLEVPERVWYQIKQTIVNKKQGTNLIGLILRWLSYFQIKRPVLVPVTAMLAVILLVSILFFGRSLSTQNGLNTYLEEQASFLSQLAENGEESYLDIDEISLGTSIEKYLL